MVALALPHSQPHSRASDRVGEGSSGGEIKGVGEGGIHRDCGKRIRIGKGDKSMHFTHELLWTHQLATHQCNDDFYTSYFPHLRRHESFVLLITFSITRDSSLDMPLGLVTHTLPMPRELYAPLYTRLATHTLHSPTHTFINYLVFASSHSLPLTIMIHQLDEPCLLSLTHTHYKENYT